MGDFVLDLALEQTHFTRAIALAFYADHHPLNGALHQRVILVATDEAAGHYLGLGHDAARLLVHGHDHDEHAIVGQGSAVAQHDFTHVADGEAVYEDVAGGNRRGAAGGAVREELDGLTVLDDEDILGRHSRFHGQAAVLDEHPELAVDRDEVFGPRQPEHQLEFFLAGMARHVDLLHAVVVDVGPGLEEVVDRPGHVLLVAGDGAGADDDGVSGLNLHETVVAPGHAGQADHRLTLGAGRGDHDAVDRPDLVLGHDLARRVRQVPEVRGDAEVLLHRSAYDRDLAIEGGRSIDNLLNASAVAGEGGNDDPAVQRLHDLPESLAHRSFGERI